MTIRRSRDGTLYAGTRFKLTAEINVTLSSEEMNLTISWKKEMNSIDDNNDRIHVSSISGSDGRYTASLTYSPILTSDRGNITATVTVSVSNMGSIISEVTAVKNLMLAVTGMCTYFGYTCS